MKIVGIDPGKEGFVAFYNDLTNGLKTSPMPVGEGGEWDESALLHAVVEWRLKGFTEVFVENCHAFPNITAHANWEVATGFAFLRMACHATGLRLHRVPAEIWKKKMGILVPVPFMRDEKGKRRKATAKEKAETYKLRKEKAVAEAERVFKRSFRGPKGGIKDGEAEASLLALYGVMTFNEEAAKAQLELKLILE